MCTHPLSHGIHQQPTTLTSQPSQKVTFFARPPLTTLNSQPSQKVAFLHSHRSPLSPPNLLGRSLFLQCHRSPMTTLTSCPSKKVAFFAQSPVTTTTATQPSQKVVFPALSHRSPVILPRRLVCEPSPPPISQPSQRVASLAFQVASAHGIEHI